MQIFLGSHEVSLKEPISEDFLYSHFEYHEHTDEYHSSSAVIRVDENFYITDITMYACGSRIDDIEAEINVPEDYSKTRQEMEALGYILTVYYNIEGIVEEITVTKDYLTVSIGPDVISLRADKEASNISLGEGNQVGNDVFCWKKGDTFQKIIITEDSGYSVLATGTFEILGVRVGEVNKYQDILNNDCMDRYNENNIYFYYDDYTIEFKYIKLDEEMVLIQSVSMFIYY